MDATELRIIHALEDLHGRDLNVRTLCTAAKCSETEFLARFSSVDDVYRACFANYARHAADMANNLPEWAIMPVEERLASFVFILLDVLAEHEELVSNTYDKFASGYFSEFQTILRSQVTSFLESADVSGVNKTILDNGPVRVAVADSVVRLIRLWIEDDSSEKDRSIALIDRTVSWWADIFSNPIPETTVSLIRYAVEAGYIPVKSIPFVSQWFEDDPGDSDNPQPQEQDG